MRPAVGAQHEDLLAGRDVPQDAGEVTARHADDDKVMRPLERGHRVGRPGRVTVHADYAARQQHRQAQQGDRQRTPAAEHAGQQGRQEGQERPDRSQVAVVHSVERAAESQVEEDGRGGVPAQEEHRRRPAALQPATGCGVGCGRRLGSRRRVDARVRAIRDDRRGGFGRRRVGSRRDGGCRVRCERVRRRGRQRSRSGRACGPPAHQHCCGGGNGEHAEADKPVGGVGRAEEGRQAFDHVAQTLPETAPGGRGGLACLMFEGKIEERLAGDEQRHAGQRRACEPGEAAAIHTPQAQGREHAAAQQHQEEVVMRQQPAGGGQRQQHQRPPAKPRLGGRQPGEQPDEGHGEERQQVVLARLQGSGQHRRAEGPHRRHRGGQQVVAQHRAR